jgi:TPP-dependent trihydroxycyclohexane-1,2-dione (THcHDO) dehydratase
MCRLLVVFVIVISACGSSSANQSAALCAALVGLGGNRADFETAKTAATVSEAYAAIDRMSERTTQAVAALRAITDGRIADEARLLAEAEEGLIPVLAQFRAIKSPSDWTAVTNAYTAWFNATGSVVREVAPRLDELGVRCD